MITWTCEVCNTKMKINDNIVPKLCCSCGSSKLSSPDSVARLQTYKKYDEELDEITNRLNALYEQERPLHKRYAYIMQYFRQQKKRNLITDEEYRVRAEKYNGLKKNQPKNKGGL